MYFVAASASRPGKEHNVSISKRDGIIACDCEDATYRQKFGDVMDLDKPWKCRHVSRLCHTLGGVLSAASRPLGVVSPHTGGGCAGGAL